MAGTPASSRSGGLPLGLTGATAATRYVGATTSGAPGSGTFQVGDFSIDQTGAVYICTVAGSPGTFVKVGGAAGSVELAYVEFTSNVIISATSNSPLSGTTLVVSAGALTFDGATRIRVEGYSAAANVGATANSVLDSILTDGTTTSFGIVAESEAVPTGGSEEPVYWVRYFTPTSGSKTLQWRGYRSVANGSFAASTGSTQYMPGFIRVSTA